MQVLQVCAEVKSESHCEPRASVFLVQPDASANGSLAT